MHIRGIDALAKRPESDCPVHCAGIDINEAQARCQALWRSCFFPLPRVHQSRRLPVSVSYQPKHRITGCGTRPKRGRVTLWKTPLYCPIGRGGCWPKPGPLDWALPGPVIPGLGVCPGCWPAGVPIWLAGVPPAPCALGLGICFCFLRVEDELPLGIEAVIVVDLDAFAFPVARHAGDAAADGLRARVGRGHSAGTGRGEDVTDHVRGGVALPGPVPVVVVPGWGKPGDAPCEPGAVG